MGTDFSFGWEIPFLEWLQKICGGAGEKIMPFFTLFGEETFLIVIFCVMYWGINKKAGIRAGLTLMISITWGALLKNIFFRVRPYVNHREIRCIKPVEEGDIYDMSLQSYSFPSGHSASAASFYTETAHLLKKRYLYIAAAFLTFSVGLSRMALGVHYPTDVLAGWALGLFTFVFLNFLESRIRDTRLYYLILVLTTVPGWFFCISNDFYTCAGVLYGGVLGNLFEERYVKFRDTRSWWRILLRIGIGAGLYFGINSSLKSAAALIADTGKAALFLRAVRYAVTIFLVTGVYPVLFRPLHLEEAADEK